MAVRDRSITPSASSWATSLVQVVMWISSSSESPCSVSVHGITYDPSGSGSWATQSFCNHIDSRLTADCEPVLLSRCAIWAKLIWHTYTNS